MDTTTLRNKKIKTGTHEFPLVDVTIGKLRIRNCTDWSDDKTNPGLVVQLDDVEMSPAPVELSIYFATETIPSFNLTARAV